MNDIKTHSDFVEIFGGAKPPKPIMYLSGRHAFLSIMSDGRWWTRPTLKTAFASERAGNCKRGYNWLKGECMSAWRRGLIRRAANPNFDGIDAGEQMRRAPRNCNGISRASVIEGGVRKCRYVYQITELGRELLAGYEAGTFPKRKPPSGNRRRWLEGGVLR